MFDSCDDAAVVDAITGSSREQNAACGRELAAIGELYARRAPEDDDERLDWAIDGFENVVAEISAALNISRGRAKGRLDYAIALRERLPKVAEVFATGAIDFRMMAALVNRTDNVDDPQLLARLDAALARWSPTWMNMSGPKLTERIDMWVSKFDPAGVRTPKQPRDDRYVEIGPSSPGMAGVWAKLPVTDAIVLDDRLDAMTAMVCPDDPRTKDQRRADALAALAGPEQRLACGCASEDCPAASADKPVGEVVIHVLAEQATVDGHSESPGYVPGFGALPAATVQELAGTAKLKPVDLPSPIAESGYRPSTALAEFVRCRDLTCRFPGCDRPAQVCDLDHTIAWPLGPTHPSNLKLLCRYHHLLKTFYTGPGGWADRQLPDGTVIWNAPNGHTYTTTPGGTIFFPQLATPTGELVIPHQIDPMGIGRGLMMPRRKRSRYDDHRARVAAERRFKKACLQRYDWLAHELRKHQACLTNDEPPPF